MPEPDLEPYINTAGFAARLGLAVQPLAYRISRGAVLDPDIVVGDVLIPGGTPGWTLQRVNFYIDYEKLLRKLNPGARRSLDVFTAQAAPSWWQVETEWYLSQQEVADVLGYQPITVTMGLIRGSFPVRPVVQIGEQRSGIKRGWDHDEVIAFGQQNKHLGGDGKVVDIARNGPPRKSVDPAYWERITRQRRERRRVKPGMNDELPIAA